eukprot:COSAG01_NODE_8555_length_2743_cov_12.852496_2_plen_437_part_00
MPAVSQSGGWRLSLRCLEPGAGYSAGVQLRWVDLVAGCWRKHCPCLGKACPGFGVLVARCCWGGGRAFPPEFRQGDLLAPPPHSELYWMEQLNEHVSVAAWTGLAMPQQTEAFAWMVQRRWHNCYPVLQNSLRPPRGNWSTSGPAREHTWDLLAQYSANQPAGPNGDGSLSSAALNSRLGNVRGAFTMDFRVDAFGNVVCLGSDTRSVTGFQVDHIFPNSRGGLSHNDNGIALYWGANQGVKSDHLVNTLAVTDMQCGLRADDLLTLVDDIRHGEQSNRERQKRAQELQAMLTKCNGKGKGSVEDFQRLVQEEPLHSAAASSSSGDSARRLERLKCALVRLRDGRLQEQIRLEQIRKHTQKERASATHVRCLASGECARCALTPGGRVWAIDAINASSERVCVRKRAQKHGHCYWQFSTYGSQWEFVEPKSLKHSR